VSEGDDRTRWLEELADGVDVYAICGPSLSSPRAPTGHVYFDHLMF
jgi:hypothetical protein